jgi:hypothetical protein
MQGSCARKAAVIRVAKKLDQHLALFERKNELQGMALLQAWHYKPIILACLPRGEYLIIAGAYFMVWLRRSNFLL